MSISFNNCSKLQVIGRYRKVLHYYIWALILTNETPITRAILSRQKFRTDCQLSLFIGQRYPEFLVWKAWTILLIAIKVTKIKYEVSRQLIPEIFETVFLETLRW